MSDADPFSVYLQLADKVFKHEVKLNVLSKYIPTLPPLDRNLLERLAEESEKASLSQPRMSWAICCVAEKASRYQKLDLFTRSLAAWYLGRAANRWVQPQKITKAIARARRGFVKLGDTGWVAACDWMANDLPWASENLIKSEEIIIDVVKIFRLLGFTDFLPHCLLTLSEIQILLEKQVDAEYNINDSESLFHEKKDDINVARCLMIRANCFRRQSRFIEANEFVKKSELIFEKYFDLQDLGKLYYYYGLICLFSTTNFTLTSDSLIKAINIFSKLEIDLWKGMCLTFIGVTCVQTGQLFNALSFYNKAESIFTKYQIKSLLGQNYNAIGRLNSLLGNLNESICQLKIAKKIHMEIGRISMVAMDSIAIGDAYFQQGRYQDALHSYESVIELLSSEKEKVHFGLFQLNLANYWLSLKNYKQAEKHINLADSNLQKSNQFDSQVIINITKARIQFELGQYDNSELILLNILNQAKSKMLTPQIASIQLNLGDLLIIKGNKKEALQYLKSAKKNFYKMGMRYELVSCLTSIGTCYIDIKSNLAKKYFHDALQINEGSFKDLEWRAFAGLAELEKSDETVNLYRQALRAINDVRMNFWQPNLAAAYAMKPSAFIRKAISYSSKNFRINDTLEFIETEKSKSLIQQLSITQTDKTINDTQVLTELKDEIKRIKNEILLLSDGQNSLITDIETKQLRLKLKEISILYNEQVSQEERKISSIDNPTMLPNFSLSTFIVQANEHFNNKWIALNYFISNEQLYITEITPNESKLKVIPMTNRFQQLLQSCCNPHKTNLDNFQDDLAKLGQILIPDDVLDRYSTDTTIIIVPHQILHGVPWAAIGRPPLVQRFIPIIIPSLHFLQHLWKIASKKENRNENRGLIIGISSFEGRYPDLAVVKKEIEIIHSLNKSDSLFENVNSITDLKEIIDGNPTPFRWLHLATHFFNDTNIGRLGGFALKKEDIWIDQIRDFKFLPKLITFSGCNSLYSKIFAGDEQISLSSTCFLAGAESVVGCLRPILDTSTTKIIKNFYKNINISISPSISLALAQRTAIDSKEDFNSWYSYLYIGTE